MRTESRATLASVASLLVGLTVVACADDPPTSAEDTRASAAFSPAIIAEGLQIFRFETFGNETFWTDTAALHEKIAEIVTPTVALSVGLKVDIEALPAALRAQLLGGQVDLNSTASTIALLSHDAVVGVKGQVENGNLVRVGVTCALCHSTVDNSTPIPGVGRRLDGWPNRDLNVGAIIALSDNPLIPDFPYNSWGPGMYDPRFNHDGLNTPVVLPPAFGLRHVSKETYTGDGPVSYWNAYVAITQMHGHGFFSDPRINVDISNGPIDLVSDKLPALRTYQLSLEAPEAKPGSYDVAAAKRGEKVFRKEGGCARCHRSSIFSDINSHRLHDPADVGQDPSYVVRSATKQLRTTPLRGLWNPPQLDGPYFHDGSAATLEAVVEHYVEHFNLKLTTRQKADLVEYLKTL